MEPERTNNASLDCCVDCFRELKTVVVKIERGLSAARPITNGKPQLQYLRDDV